MNFSLKNAISNISIHIHSRDLGNPLAGFLLKNNQPATYFGLSKIDEISGSPIGIADLCKEERGLLWKHCG